METRCGLNQNTDGRLSEKTRFCVSACEDPRLEVVLLTTTKDREGKGEDLWTLRAFSHPKCDIQRLTMTPIWIEGDMSGINWYGTELWISIMKIVICLQGRMRLSTDNIQERNQVECLQKAGEGKIIWGKRERKYWELRKKRWSRGIWYC